MHYASLHNHTTYCDGSNSAEEMVIAAIEKNLKTVGISTHGPLPFRAKYAIDKEKIEDYIREVNLLKEKYKEKIQVLLGMEFDYFFDEEFSHVDPDLFDRLDYWIGSVHYLGRYESGEPWAVDASLEAVVDGIEKSYDKNVQKAFEDYYKFVGEMVIKYRPNIVGHLDLIKKNNKNNVLFDENEDWYRKAVFGCLEKIKSAGSVLEINTGARARGHEIEQYPSKWILEQCNKLDIPITLNADAHKSIHIAYMFDEMHELIKSLQINNFVYLTSIGWEKLKIM